MNGQNPAAALALLGWVFTGILALVAIVGTMAGNGGLVANSTIGIRIPPLLRSDAAWRAGHAATVMPAIVCGAVALVLCLIGIFDLPAYWGALGVCIVGIVWALIRAVRAADRA